jgi:pimeloyl-ACP methyl ester carboxylesterase
MSSFPSRVSTSVDADRVERETGTPSDGIVQLDWHGRALAIEYRWVGSRSSRLPAVVFLHEGLGSVAMWKDFPERFCAAHGFTGLVFSRYGYGRSTPKPPGERWAPDFMHRQAFAVLPAFLAALGIERPWLFGHSDGASIALLHAARFPVAGVVAVAPHIFVEAVSVASIAAARSAYAETDLRERLARYHDDPDSAFRGWNDVWLDPAFRDWNIEAELDAITCPVLAVQGEDDEYGTLEQIRGIARRLPKTRLLVLPKCGHSPHRDQPERLIQEAGRFILESTPH